MNQTHSNSCFRFIAGTYILLVNKVINIFKGGANEEKNHEKLSLRLLETGLFNILIIMPPIEKQLTLCYYLLDKVVRFYNSFKIQI